MADNLDKTRPEQLGERAFVGTGVGTFPDILEEQKDLRQMMQEMINEALSTVVGATVIQDVPDQITYNFFGGGITRNELAQVVAAIQDEYDERLDSLKSLVYHLYYQLKNEIKDLQQQINDLQSGTGVNVYKWVSNNATAGNYNCYLQAWIDGAWANVDTKTVVVDNVVESSGHSFNATVYFYSLGRPDKNDVVPVNVLELSVKKAYVKTTPGATTTLACYLDVDATGTEINVACVIDGGGNLNAAHPPVEDGDYIWVKRVASTWLNVTPFAAVEGCQ